MKLSSFGQTDVGKVRDNNQDSFFVGDRCFIIADGMGGHAGGAEASKMAVSILSKELEGFKKRKKTDQNFQEFLVSTVKDANDRIFQSAQRNQSLKGMGTTVTLLYFLEGEKNELFIAQVGDSRGYMVREGFIWQLTEDHSLVNEQVKAGMISRELAKKHQYRNVVTRSLGVYQAVEVDTYVKQVENGDAYLICSDGLSNYVKDEEILAIVSLNSEREGAKKLIALANERGGDDNITVVIVKVAI